MTGTMPLLHGEAGVAESNGTGPAVSFVCGEAIYSLVDWASPDQHVDTMLRFAEALVPHLYCTLGPPPA